MEGRMLYDTFYRQIQWIKKFSVLPVLALYVHDGAGSTREK